MRTIVTAVLLMALSSRTDERPAPEPETMAVSGVYNLYDAQIAPTGGACGTAE